MISGTDYFPSGNLLFFPEPRKTGQKTIFDLYHALHTPALFEKGENYIIRYMKITNSQLDEYIALYETSFGEKLEPTRALVQFNKLLSLVLIMIFSEKTIASLEKELKEEYNKDATCKP